MDTKKFLDQDGLTYFARKLNDYPDNTVLSAIVNAIDQSKADSNLITENNGTIIIKPDNTFLSGSNNIVNGIGIFGDGESENNFIFNIKDRISVQFIINDNNNFTLIDENEEEVTFLNSYALYIPEINQKFYNDNDSLEELFSFMQENNLTQIDGFLYFLNLSESNGNISFCSTNLLKKSNENFFFDTNNDILNESHYNIFIKSFLNYNLSYVSDNLFYNHKNSTANLAGKWSMSRSREIIDTDSYENVSSNILFYTSDGYMYNASKNFLAYTNNFLIENSNINTIFNSNNFNLYEGSYNNFLYSISNSNFFNYSQANFVILSQGSCFSNNTNNNIVLSTGNFIQNNHNAFIFNYGSVDNTYLTSNSGSISYTDIPVGLNRQDKTYFIIPSKNYQILQINRSQVDESNKTISYSYSGLNNTPAKVYFSYITNIVAPANAILGYENRVLGLSGPANFIQGAYNYIQDSSGTGNQIEGTYHVIQLKNGVFGSHIEGTSLLPWEDENYGDAVQIADPGIHIEGAFHKIYPYSLGSTGSNEGFHLSGYHNTIQNYLYYSKGGEIGGSFNLLRNSHYGLNAVKGKFNIIDSSYNLYMADSSRYNRLGSNYSCNIFGSRNYISNIYGVYLKGNFNNLKDVCNNGSNTSSTTHIESDGKIYSLSLLLLDSSETFSLYSVQNFSSCGDIIPEYGIGSFSQDYAGNYQNGFNDNFYNYYYYYNRGLQTIQIFNIKYDDQYTNFSTPNFTTCNFYISVTPLQYISSSHLEGFHNYTAFNGFSSSTSGLNHIEGVNNSFAAIQTSHIEGSSNFISSSQGNHIEGGSTNTQNYGISFEKNDQGYYDPKNNNDLMFHYNKNYFTSSFPIPYFQDGQQYVMYKYSGGFSLQSSMYLSSKTLYMKDGHYVYQSILTHVEGKSNIAINTSVTHIEGYKNFGYSGGYGHIEGSYNYCQIGSDDHVEGTHNEILNDGSCRHIGGSYNKVSTGSSSIFLHGYQLQHNKSCPNGSAFFGYYNLDLGNGTIFSVGNGSSEEKRSNAFTIRSDGSGFFQKGLYINENESVLSSKAITEEYDASKKYVENDYVIYNNKLYEALEETAEGPFESEKWKETSIINIIDQILTAYLSQI